MPQSFVLYSILHTVQADVLQPWSEDTDQLLAVLLQLLTTGLSQACFQPLVLQLLLQLLKLLPADSPLLQLTDAPCPGGQLHLHHTPTGTWALAPHLVLPYMVTVLGSLVYYEASH